MHIVGVQAAEGGEKEKGQGRGHLSSEHMFNNHHLLGFVSLGEGNSNSLQYPCLGNPTEREAWHAIVHSTLFRGQKEPDMTEQPPHTDTHTPQPWLQLPPICPFLTLESRL